MKNVLSAIVIVLLLVLVYFVLSNIKYWWWIPVLALGYIWLRQSNFPDFESRDNQLVNKRTTGTGEVTVHEKYADLVQHFREVYAAGRPNHKTEHLIMAMFDTFVDTGSFVEGYKPDWLLGQDDLSDSGPKVPLELDGYNHTENQKDICVEYNGPVHYISPTGSKEEKIKWLRGRRNDEIKRKHFKSDASKHFIVIHYLVPLVYLDGRSVLQTLASRRVSLEDQIQIYMKYVLSRLAEIKRLKDYFGDNFGGMTPTKYLSSMGMYIDPCAEPALSGDVRKQMHNLVVSYATPLAMDRGEYKRKQQQQEALRRKAAEREARAQQAAEKEKRRIAALASRAAATPKMY